MAMLVAARLASRPYAPRVWASTDAKSRFKVVIVGAGSAGLSVANQLYNRFAQAKHRLNEGDIAVLDAAEYHHYQPGWTLVGAGLGVKSNFRRPLSALIPSHITHISENVKAFSPSTSSVTTESGDTISYDYLVVSTGLQINWTAIPGLSDALANPSSGVSSIYSYDTCDKVWSDIETLRNGSAIFTQPAGIIKCAGAPQKIMWMAWDRYRRTGRGNNISIDFFTGMPTMFSVKKYSDALEKLRVKRSVGGHFQHNLVSVDSANRKATFKRADDTVVSENYTLLHVTPPMGPSDIIKGSPISDAAGWVDVHQETLRHNKFGNIFALGDCSSLPTSKTAAAITAQAPVLVENLYSLMRNGAINEKAKYDGYTSCPLLTGYGELMLAEFKYGLEPKETFAPFIDQSKPRRAFFHLKKDFFPRVYWSRMVKGEWFGTKAWYRPSFMG